MEFNIQECIERNTTETTSEDGVVSIVVDWEKVNQEQDAFITSEKNKVASATRKATQQKVTAKVEPIIEDNIDVTKENEELLKQVNDLTNVVNSFIGNQERQEKIKEMKANAIALNVDMSYLDLLLGNPGVDLSAIDLNSLPKVEKQVGGAKQEENTNLDPEKGSLSAEDEIAEARRAFFSKKKR